MKDQEMIMETVKTPDEKKKDAKRYLILLLVDSIYTFLATVALAWFVSIADEAGLGASLIGFQFFLIGFLIMIIHGFVSYVKCRSVMIPHLIFLFLAFTSLSVLFILFSDGSAAIAIGFWIFTFIPSLISSMIALIILKARKYFKKKKENSAQ